MKRLRRGRDGLAGSKARRPLPGDDVPAAADEAWPEPPLSSLPEADLAAGGAARDPAAQYARSLIALRWWVPAGILLTAAIGWGLGFRFALLPLVGVAVAMWAYNGLLLWWARRLERERTAGRLPARCRGSFFCLAVAEVGLDYAAMIALVALSGGAASPLLAFYFFHIIFAAMLLGPRLAWVLATVAAVSAMGVAVSDAAGILALPPVLYRGQAVVAEVPAWAGVRLALFAVTAFTVAGLTAGIMDRLRSESEQLATAQAVLAEERARLLLQVAHNLRAPLDASMSILDVVRQGYAGELAEPQRQTLDRVRDRLSALASLVSELLLLGGTVDQRVGVRHQAVDLAGVARSAVALFAAATRQRSLELMTALPASPLWVSIDAAVLRQVIENLLSNALKYTPPGGRVWLEAATTDGQVRLQVRDSGIGIPPEDQARLFSPFFRARNARSIDGTGLGLAFVKEAIERHAGTVEFTSREGEGSTFAFSLPLVPPPQ